MLAIRLEHQLVEQIDLLAKSKHTNRSAIIREAVTRFLEDNEDLKLAALAQKQMKSAKSIKKIRKDLGLDSKD